MVIQLDTLLTPEQLEQLRARAESQNTPVESLVQEVLEDYLAEDQPGDLTDEEILADLEEAFQDIAAGRTRPAREMLEELRQKRMQHAAG